MVNVGNSVVAWFIYETKHEPRNIFAAVSSPRTARRYAGTKIPTRTYSVTQASTHPSTHTCRSTSFFLSFSWRGCNVNLSLKTPFEPLGIRVNCVFQYERWSSKLPTLPPLYVALAGNIISVSSLKWIPNVSYILALRSITLRAVCHYNNIPNRDLDNLQIIHRSSTDHILPLWYAMHDL